MANNPTIVSASLSDKELQDSINKMVANFDKGLQTMLEHSNEYVGKIQASLQKIGDTNFGAKGSNDGAVAKQTKAQNADTDAIEKNIAARDKQIKKNQEAAMSFDQMQTAIQKASRMPSEMRPEKTETRARDSYYAFVAGLKEQRESLAKVINDFERGLNNVISKRTNEINNQITASKNKIQELNQELNRANATRNAARASQVQGQLDKELRHYKDLESQLKNVNNEFGTSKISLAAMNAEHHRLANLMRDETQVQQQQAQTTRQQITEEQRRTEEIRKQAAAIRATKEWQEKGHVVIGDTNYYDKERANVSKRDKQLLLSLEEQIVQAQQKESQEALVAAEANRQKAQAAKEAAQAMRGMSSYDLGIDPNVSAGRQRQIELTRKASQGTEHLRQQVASLLEVEEREVKSVNMTTASYSELSQHLKQLQSAYNKLGADRIKKGEGVDIANEIQRTQRAMQKLQQTMSRPVSLKDAFGGSEKTLDDLAYKMRRLQSYRGGLNFKTQSDEVLRVNQKYAELQKKMDVIMERNQRMIASNNALGRSWNYMKNRLAFYVTVGAGTSFIKQLIDIRSQYEMNEKALGILLDSASRGTRIFNELSQMALVSPYTLIELSNAAKQLTAYDIAAKDVVDTTRRLADMASAVGVPVERLTYALGQIKAYGYLNSRDARMFANAGIPLVKQLADRYSELEGKMVSTADVYDRMKKKAIDYNDVMAVINKMTDEGGKFFDFQAKMAETLKVRLANLTLAWNNMLNDMGKDNQGWFSSGLKGLTTAFKHWRELYRIISTVIVAIGAYKTASMLVGVATSRAVSSTIPAWFRLANIVRTTQGNMALLGLTMRSIPFTAWFTAIATLASYFVLFNNSSDDVKQKLEEIKNAFDGVRKEVETLFADAIKTDNIGTQLTKLRDMLELAETELGVTIPIRLEDVNESNIKQKLKEAKQFIDEYINFSQTFSEAAAGTKFNELMNDFGSKARSTYTNVTESINSVVVALQELSDKGQASKRDIEILNELTSGQKDDESRIEYLQRLIRLYEELGLIGQKKVTPKVSFFGSSEDNIEELEQQQENALDRLGIKNKSVFENMLKDVQGYYSSSSIAAYQFEQQVMRVAEKIDINNIPVEQRTMKLTAAINEEASQNNWNQFEKELARQIANEKFGTTIEISDESKKAAEEDLQAWQRNIQNWAKNNGITFDVSFQTNDTEASYAKRMLQEAKDAKELWETLGRKEKQGTGSKDATTKAYNDYIERRKLAAAAGADLSSLDAKSRKAAKQAESELQKALKDELSTIDKVRSIYKDLTKEGMSHADAVERATRGWDETVNAINRVLQKNGLQKLDLSKFAGIENPRELVNMLQSQLNTLLKRGAKPAEIKELQTKVNTLEVDAGKYDLTKITKGLNNELGKLKDEYELAVELDANPELGSIFADYMGIDLNELPKNAEEAAKKAQQYIDKILRENKSKEKIDIASLMGKDAFDKWIKSSGHSMEDNIVKVVDNYRQALHKMQVDESKKQMQEWEKLLEKYAEYEYKVSQIQKQAEREREIARKKGASQEILDAINERERQELARVSFEEFQKTPEWIVATGDLANMSKSAIGMLIEQLEKYKRSAKNLSPKQIKQLNSALSKLYKEQRKNNPFKAISNMLDEAKERMATFDEDIEKTQKEIDNLTKKKKESIVEGVADEETDNKLKKAIKRLKELKEAREKTGKVDASSWVSSINETIGAVQSAIGVFNDLAKAIGGVDSSDLDKVFSVVDKAGQGAAIGAQIGGGWGALIGAVAGAATGLISIFAGAANERITDKVEESERAVKRLENAYKELEYAAENAFGAATSGAQEAIKANKELQLVELKRQLALEQSRDSKHRDEDRIIEIRGQIIDLEHEINDLTKNAVNDLLGISSHGDFFESMISEMIEAFKNGEDAMKVFEEKWSDMIDNMIMKTIVSQVLSQWVKTLEHGANEILEKYTEESSKKMADLASEMTNLRTMDAGDASEWIYDNDRETFNKILESLGVEKVGDMRAKERWTWFDKAWGSGLAQKITDAYLAMLDNNMAGLQDELDKASLDATGELIDYYGEAGKEFKENYLGQILDKIQENWNFGQDSEKQLSNLQQGIQGLSEDTGSALESYMNGVSQQVYLQSNLLTQIRDAVVGMNMDVQVATQAQMLLQLQQSYAVQMAIQGILEGVLTPSGRAFSVELLS